MFLLTFIILDIKLKNMKKFLMIFIILFLLLISSFSLFAIEVSPRISDKEIIERLTKLEEGQKELRKEVNKNFKILNTRIDDLDKKLNSRIDDLDKKLNSRINDLDKKLSGRINDLDKKLSGRINDLDKKLNKRIDDLRFEMNNNFKTLQWMLGLFTTLFLVIVGFILRMLWLMQKKQTALDAMLKTQREELSFIKTVIEKLIPPKEIL